MVTTLNYTVVGDLDVHETLYLLGRTVATKPEDYTYPVGPCVYVMEGDDEIVRCIVGELLHFTGIATDAQMTNAYHCSGSVEQLLGELSQGDWHSPFDDASVALLMFAQALQDDGYPWHRVYAILRDGVTHGRWPATVEHDHNHLGAYLRDLRIALAKGA